MKYDVTIFAVVRVKIPGVSADMKLEAIEKAEKQVDLDKLFNRQRGVIPAPLPTVVEYTAYAEDSVGFLIDEEGDEDFEKSVVYDYNSDGELVPSGRGTFTIKKRPEAS